MLRHVIIALSIISAFSLAGCAEPVRPEVAQSPRAEHVIDKNYKLNELLEAYVGDPIIRVRDYYLSRTVQTTASAQQVVTIKGGSWVDGSAVNISVKKGQLLDIAGTTRVDGQEFTVLKYPVNSTYYHGILVDESGHVYHKVRVDFVRPYTYTVTPADARFVRKEKETVDTESGYVNFEILYTGRDSDSIHLAYREFTPENLARAAFFQNLTYSANSGTIRFRDIKLEIEEATNERVRYKVISDSLP